MSLYKDSTQGSRIARVYMWIICVLNTFIIGNDISKK